MNNKRTISRGFGPPSSKEGRDGDLAVRFVKGQGLFLFYKWANKWYSNRLSLYKNKTNELKDPVRIPIKTPSKVGELGLIGSKAYLLRNHSTTGKNQFFSVDKNGIGDVKEVALERTNTKLSDGTTDMDDDNAGTPDWIFQNSGHSHLQIHTTGANMDSYVSLSAQHPDTFANRRWLIGFDSSAGDLTFNYKSDTSLSGMNRYIAETPSTSANYKLKISNAGVVSINNIPTGTTTSYLIEDGGAIKKRSLPTSAITALNSATENELVTVGSTTTELDAEANLLYDGTGLKIKEAADASSDTTAYGQLWVHDTTPNELMFTDDTGTDISTIRHSACWGGNLARTTGKDGEWLGIPTGYQAAAISFGTTATAPQTANLIATTGDDVLGTVWQPFGKILVTGCRIYFAQGGSTNTTHRACLMRYTMDADGDLMSGVQVGEDALDSDSDDYSQIGWLTLSLTSTAADLKVSGAGNNDVLVAMVYCVDAINGAMGAKCVLEYQQID